MNSDKNKYLSSEELDVAIKAFEGMKKEVIGGYMIIELSYIELIFPFDEGLKVVEALKHAKSFTYPFGKAPKISPLGRHKIQIMSEAEVLSIHTAQLLEIEDEDKWSELRDEISKTFPNLRTKSST